MGIPNTNAQEQKKGMTPIQIFHTAVTLFLMFGFRFIPPFSTLTPVGMAVLGVFLGVVYGYSTCEIVWPSLFAVIAFGTSGFTSMGAAITSMMGHNVVFQCIVGFISAGALSHYGFGKWFVRWSLGLKVFKGKPLFYTWCFITLFGVSAVVINQIQLQIILYTIWLDIAKNCGYSEDSDFIYAGIVGIMMSTILGGAMVPYSGWMLGLANNWADASGIPLNFGSMGVMCVFATILISTLYVLSLQYVFKIDFSIMQRFDESKLGDDSKHLNKRSKRIIIVYFATIIIVIMGNTFPPGSALFNLVNNTLTIAGVYCICAAILLILPSGEGDGKPCIEFYAIKDKAISWTVIFMCAVTLPIAAAVTNPDCGIVEWLTQVFTPLFAGKSSLYVLIFTIFVSLFLTNLGSNIAFGAAMIPIITPFVLRSGLDPQFAGAAMIYAINIGMVLPGASAPASIVHSHEALPLASKRFKFTLWGCAMVLLGAIPYFSILYLFMG